MRFGDTRTVVTSWSLAVSGACCLTAGLFFAHPLALTADYAANLAGNENNLMILKARVGRRIAETLKT